MTPDRSNGEFTGVKFFNWALIVGAAVLVATTFNSFAPHSAQPAKAKQQIETVVVSAPAPHHTS
jgi:hypothetical protein